jgi:hypothetical protein
VRSKTTKRQGWLDDGGCVVSVVAAIAILVLGLGLVGTAIVWNMDKTDITPSWWTETKYVKGPFGMEFISHSLLRMVLASIVCVPAFWAVVGLAKEVQTGFVTTYKTEPGWLWGTWTTSETWQERFWPTVWQRIGVTYTVVLGASVLAYIATPIFAYIATGTLYYVGYSFLLFSVLAIGMCLPLPCVFVPVHKLMKGQSVGKKLLGSTAVAIELCGFGFTVRDIISLFL